MDHTLALIMKSQQGDKEARDTVFKENAGLVYSMAKRFCRAQCGNGRYRADRKHWATESHRSFLIFRTM